jgi:hypothetical protein
VLQDIPASGDRAGSAEQSNDAELSTIGGPHGQTIAEAGLLMANSDDVLVSESVLQAFMQNSPSAAHLTVGTPHNEQAILIAKRRVVEEMNRIQDRAHVTEQQRQQYMQTALGMDAPKLARSLMKDETEARNELFSLEEMGHGAASMHTSTSDLDVGSSLSFLTGGEMLILQERASEQAETSAATHPGRLQPFTPEGAATMNAAHAAHNKAVADTLDSLLQDSDGEYTGAAAEASDASDEDLEETVRVVKEVSSAEKRQSDEDARFSKAVEEVERVRKRYIQKASLPLVGALSREEKASSASLVSLDSSAVVTAYGGTLLADTGSARPSTGGPGGGTSSTGLSQMGARIRKPSSGHLQQGISVSNSRNTSSNNLAAAAKNKSALSIANLDEEPAAGSQFPLLGPSQGKSPAKYLLVPERDPYRDSTSMGSTTGEEVYSVQSRSLSPRPGRHESGAQLGTLGVGSPREGPGKPVKSLRTTSGSSNSTVSSSAVGSSTLSASDRWHSHVSSVPPLDTAGLAGSGYFIDPEAEDGDAYHNQQDAVANSIDMLLSSRFNTARSEAAREDDPPPALLGNSLVLLQQRLESADRAAGSSYHNLRPDQHAQYPQQAQPGRVSQTAATALATLSRPGSAGRPLTGRRCHPTPAAGPDGAGMPSPAQLPALDLKYKQEEAGAQGLRSSGESVLSMGSQLFAFKSEGIHVRMLNKMHLRLTASWMILQVLTTTTRREDSTATSPTRRGTWPRGTRPPSCWAPPPRSPSAPALPAGRPQSWPTPASCQASAAPTTRPPRFPGRARSTSPAWPGCPPRSPRRAAR